MLPRDSNIASTFARFVDMWLDCLPLIYDRVDELDARSDAQGTVEDFSNLVRIVDSAIQCISVGAAPPRASVPRACFFVRLWSEPDELADRIRSLAEAYATAAEELLPLAPGDSGGAILPLQRVTPSARGPAE